MGISFKKLLPGRAREEPVAAIEAAERVASIEITDQQIYEMMNEIAIRELAFWVCVGKISNILANCEFRTFIGGKEVFKEEYYLWNYSPNRNQSKVDFWNHALEKLYRNNELLIIESYDGQLLVADSFTTTPNALYGDTYSNVQVGDFQFARTFGYRSVLHWKLNDKNVNQLIGQIYSSYGKLINYAQESYLKSRGSRGILNIDTMASGNKNFEETFKKLMNEHFKSFFKSSNAVLPLFQGYTYKDLDSKTYSEESSRDIKNQYDDVFDFTARGFGIAPALVKGNVQDTSQAINETLTFCIDPLCRALQTEIVRKRYGVEMVTGGSWLRIDTSRVKHMDMFDIAPAVEKCVSSGLYTINMLLRAIGEPQLDEPWADQHFITKNYAAIQEALNMVGGGENK